MDWPDFGCPSETASLLELCQMMRNYHKREGGKIVVHCRYSLKMFIQKMSIQNYGMNKKYNTDKIGLQ